MHIQNGFLSVASICAIAVFNAIIIFFLVYFECMLLSYNCENIKKKASKLICCVALMRQHLPRRPFWTYFSGHKQFSVLLVLSDKLLYYELNTRGVWKKFFHKENKLHFNFWFYTPKSIAFIPGKKIMRYGMRFNALQKSNAL